MSENYVCGQCGNPAASSTVFKKSTSPYEESTNCPKCGSPEIVSKQTYQYILSWPIIKASGIDTAMMKEGASLIKVTLIGNKKNEERLGYNDVPEDVIKELEQKRDRINQIIEKSGIKKELAELGTTIDFNVGVWRSK